jgi:diguanylate cyclase (GGDEF)-like protein
MHPRDWLKSILTPTNVPAAIALVVIVISGLIADNLNSTVFEQRLRADVLGKLSLVRARLEGNINGNIQLVRGLISTISTEPNMDQARFAALTANLFKERSQLRNVAGAPNMVVSLMYPVQGNEKAMGLNYNTDPRQGPATQRARDLGELVLAGPVKLVQGGTGFIGRFPVFIGPGKRPENFWGIVSAVVDADRLYQDSGLLEPNLGIDIAITGQDATGLAGQQFYGKEAIYDRDPVTATVTLPTGYWQIAAAPKNGWNTTPENALIVRLLIIAAGIVVFIPIVISGRLIEERQRNIKELHSRQQQLAKLSQRLGLALDTSRVGVWEMNIANGDLVWDGRMNELYGLPADGGARDYSHWKHALHPDDFERAEEDFARAIGTKGRYHSEYRVVLPNGDIRNIRALGTIYETPEGPARIVGVNWDVTSDVALNNDLKRAKTLSEARNAELEAAKERIEHNSLHDSLTGLPNRRYLDEILRLHAAHCAESGGRTALLHIDLDRFKQINDTLGHAAGDAMLVHASQVLKTHTRVEDFVARIGGDEFVVVCTSGERPRDLGMLAERIIVEMRQPVMYESHECRFGVSIGIATEMGEAVDPQKLLIDADIALYRAKSRGRNRYEFFTKALQAEIVSTKRVADEILSGLERNEFVAYYQPQFDAKTLDVIGVEALARWKHPTRGLLAPDSFLRIAEELNVVANIDKLILDQALSDLTRWNADGTLVPRVSVNVSLRRLHDEDLIKSLKRLLIQPGSLSFELVESIYLDESDEIVAFNIDQIKDLGIDIEIDDFGTGYASIVSLLKLKPKRLKIDRQLVMPIVGSGAQRHLVESIIEIGQSLGIEVVAEGVETMEHARILRDLGSDILQGYAFAKAMSADDIAAFATTQPWRIAS